MTKKVNNYRHLIDAADELKKGHIGIIPTDTVYGLAVLARNSIAAQKINTIKGREQKRGTIIAASTIQLIELGFKEEDLLNVQKYWPDSVSVEMPVGRNLEYLHFGTGILAARIPADAELINLLQQTGPLMTSSANLSGGTHANTIDGAKAIFGDRIDFYVDGGDLSKREASTIVRVEDGKTKIIRKGARSINLPKPA